MQASLLRRDLGAHALRFKLHLAINDRGELLNVVLTPGNVDDRKPVKKLLQKQHGKFFADKGYISKALAGELKDRGIVLITKFKKNMNNKLMELSDKQLLRKRALIESVIEQLKHICQIEHSPHRSPQTAKLSVLESRGMLPLPPWRVRFEPRDSPLP